MIQKTVRGSVAVGLVGLVAVACGARSPLYDEYYVEAGVDASVLDASAGDASDAALDGNFGPEAGRRGGADAGGGGLLADGGVVTTVINCGQCLISSCSSQLTACVTNTACTSALQCVASTCVSGGLSPLCIIGCGASDPTDVLNLFTCVGGTCGSSCLSAIGSLGGLLGGGTDGGGIGLPGIPGVP